MLNAMADPNFTPIEEDLPPLEQFHAGKKVAEEEDKKKVEETYKDTAHPRISLLEEVEEEERKNEQEEEEAKKPEAKEETKEATEERVSSASAALDVLRGRVIRQVCQLQTRVSLKEVSEEVDRWSESKCLGFLK
jgi:vacuolar-type H+-ATPase subunit I/STV1